MKKYALVVGVENYDDPGINNLNFAAKDAREVGICLREECGFDEVREVVSGGEREPDHVSVVESLQAFAPLLEQDDLFVFFFAGHGIHTDGRSFLLAGNSRIAMPELTSVPLPLLQQCLSRFDASEREQEELRERIRFDIEECERALKRGDGTKDYIEKVCSSRLPDWKRAAERGWPEGQWLYGRSLQEGCGIAQDKADAVRWYRKAAEKEYALGQNALGSCYVNGEGVTKDEAEAVRWFRKAAEHGYAPAQCNLGVCYYNGEVGAKDESEAVRWVRKAAEQGDEYAKEALKKLEQGGCFISTAAGLIAGWEDEGPELNALRHFRDTWMRGDPELRTKVAEYYRIAPEIVRRINASDSPRAIYHRLCENYIRPAVLAIERNDPETAHRLYREMVKTLAEQFFNDHRSPSKSAVNTTISAPETPHD